MRNLEFLAKMTGRTGRTPEIWSELFASSIFACLPTPVLARSVVRRGDVGASAAGALLGPCVCAYVCTIVNKISREGKYTEDEEVSSLLLFLRGPGVSGDL